MSERVLVTGAFGNLGQTVLAELKDRGHHVTVLARDKPRNRRTARRLGALVDDVAWGDVRSADLDALVGRADAVFCPIDCVSHQACLAAKQLCRRLDKPFVPLRTGSGTCLLRALDRWRGSQAPGAAAPA